MKKSKRTIHLIIITLCCCFTACSEFKEKPEKEAIVDDPKVIYNVSTSEDEDEEDQFVVHLKDGREDNSLEIVGEDEGGFGNIPSNVKGEENEVLLCKDPVYDLVYYVNYGEDYFIYRLKDGNAELVVEIPAKRLFCMKGYLYFIVDSYNTYSFKDLEDGNILRYDPISGEVTVICDVNAWRMIVYPDGIYYKTETIIKEAKENESGMTKIELYYYSFDTENIEQIDDIYRSLYGWNDYFMTMEVVKTEMDDELLKNFPEYAGKEVTKAVGLKFETIDKSESIMLTDLPIVSHYSIIDNKIYYIKEQEYLNIFDINTKEIVSIQLPTGYSDFILIEDMIYTDRIIQVDLNSKEINFIVKESNEIIHELYTDGENIYGICGAMGDMRNGTIKRIEIVESDEEIIDVEAENGVIYEMFRYIAKSYPMGGK